MRDGTRRYPEVRHALFTSEPVASCSVCALVKMAILPSRTQPEKLQELRARFFVLNATAYQSHVPPARPTDPLLP